jgi:hypothetical protein
MTEEEQRIVDLGRELRMATRGMPEREAEAVIQDWLRDAHWLRAHEMDEVRELALRDEEAEQPPTEPQQSGTQTADGPARVGSAWEPAAGGERLRVRPRRLSSLYTTPLLGQV